MLLTGYKKNQNRTCSARTLFSVDMWGQRWRQRFW